jgi:DNA-binding ferritin-like protein
MTAFPVQQIALPTKLRWNWPCTAHFLVIDELAERMRALYGKRLSTGVANLPMTQSAECRIADLVCQNETLRRMHEVAAAAEGSGDVMTAELFDGLIARHEKDEWMLCATLRQ